MKPECPDGCPGKNFGDTCQEWAKLEDVTLAGGGAIDGDGESWWKISTRPSLMSLMWINGLTIEDLFITRPPFWTIHPVFCNNVLLRNVNVRTFGTPNGDGIDVDSCSNVLIENCTFDTGDDCIALKSGMDADGRAVGIPTANVTVRRTAFLRGHGCSIGSDMSGGVVNATFEDLTFKGTNVGVRIKDQRGRGGAVKGIVYRNASMEDVGQVLQITQFYHPGIPPTNATATPTFEDFLVQDIRATRSGAGEILCLPESPCHGLRFERVTVAASSEAVASVGSTASVGDGGASNGFMLANAYGTSTGSRMYYE
jgi:polygalacturonase